LTVLVIEDSPETNDCLLWDLSMGHRHVVEVETPFVGGCFHFSRGRLSSRFAIRTQVDHGVIATADDSQRARLKLRGDSWIRH
jgi:hypothetical protein